MAVTQVWLHLSLSESVQPFGGHYTSHDSSEPSATPPAADSGDKIARLDARRAR